MDLASFGAGCLKLAEPRASGSFLIVCGWSSSAGWSGIIDRLLPSSTYGALRCCSAYLRRPLNHRTSHSRAAVATRIGDIVVGLRVDDEGSTVCVEQCARRTNGRGKAG